MPEVDFVQEQQQEEKGKHFSDYENFVPFLPFLLRGKKKRKIFKTLFLLVFFSNIRKLKKKTVSNCEFQGHYFAGFYTETKRVSTLFWFRNWKLPLPSCLISSNFFFFYELRNIVQSSKQTEENKGCSFKKYWSLSMKNLTFLNLAYAYKENSHPQGNKNIVIGNAS